MKLDNRGWGLREMLIYSCLLLIFLLIASFRISALYSDVTSNDDVTSSNEAPETVLKDDDNTVKDTYDLQYYYTYEDEMVEATRKYLKNTEYSVTDGSEEFKLDLLTLIDLDLIDRLYDKNSDVRCEGYTMVTILNGKIAIQPYLLCRDYVTKGY